MYILIKCAIQFIGLLYTLHLLADLFIPIMGVDRWGTEGTRPPPLFSLVGTK